MNAAAGVLLSLMITAGSTQQAPTVVVASSGAYDDALWTTDGTANVTVLLKSSLRATSDGSFDGELVQVSSRGYPSGSRGAHRRSPPFLEVVTVLEVRMVSRVIGPNTRSMGTSPYPRCRSRAWNPVVP